MREPMTATHYYVYILECENNSYYTGYTTNLLRRYQEHQNGTAKCKYTRSFKPIKIAQSWSTFECKSEALAIERFIKRLPKPAKMDLILNPDQLTERFQCKPLTETTSMNTLVLATSNPGKVSELQTMLPSFRCVSQASLGIEDANETGLSFIENAILKARHASQISQRPALADDSGLVVDALNGEPGIYSARFAGLHATDAENIDLLLERMTSTPDEQRQAYFYCAIAFVMHANDPTPIISTGQLFGEISRSRVGDHGFGYDPVFYLPDHQCTLAQLPSHIKNSISHRAMALKQLRIESP
jgi:XTP/dITP diphosphohydrolase